MDYVALKKDPKIRVAVTSVIAAFVLTGAKLSVGLLTNSLGILAEALHSALDMLAAIITLIAVYYSRKPADIDHHFGHGKFENFSALLETLLLIITCIWIIYESIHRLINQISPEVNFLSFAVVIFAIIIDYERSRMLFRVAKETRSQALLADGLHFSTDILSSSVVILGLIFVSIGFPLGDAIAALGVAIIVIWISFKLGAATINALLDKVPKRDYDIILNYCIKEFPDFEIKSLRLRESGPYLAGDLTLFTPPEMHVDDFQEVSDSLHKNLSELISNLNLMILSYPREKLVQTKKINVSNIHKTIDTIRMPNNISYKTYNVSLYKNNNICYLEIYLELPKEISLSEAYNLIKYYEEEVKKKISHVDKVDIHLEPLPETEKKDWDEDENEFIGE